MACRVQKVEWDHTEMSGGFPSINYRTVQNEPASLKEVERAENLGPARIFVPKEENILFQSLVNLE